MADEQQLSCIVYLSDLKDLSHENCDKSNNLPPNKFLPKFYLLPSVQNGILPTGTRNDSGGDQKNMSATVKTSSQQSGEIMLSQHNEIKSENCSKRNDGPETLPTLSPEVTAISAQNAADFLDPLDIEPVFSVEKEDDKKTDFSSLISLQDSPSEFRLHECEQCPK